MNANRVLDVLHLPLEAPMDGAQNIAAVHTPTEVGLREWNAI